MPMSCRPSATPCAKAIPRGCRGTTTGRCPPSSAAGAPATIAAHDQGPTTAIIRPAIAVDTEDEARPGDIEGVGERLAAAGYPFDGAGRP